MLLGCCYYLLPHNFHSIVVKGWTKSIPAQQQAVALFENFKGFTSQI
jgi:hypothetical protein